MANPAAGTILRDARAAAGLSLRAVAAELGVSHVGSEYWILRNPIMGKAQRPGPKAEPEQLRLLP